MFRKPFVIAAIALSAGATLLPTEASAGDPGMGALVGGVFGAAVGHSVNGHDGAVVGGVLGALAGASIAAHSGPYYGPAYGAPPPRAYYPAAPVYVRPVPVYYAPAPMVMRPAPVLHRPAVVVYRPFPVHGRHVAPRHADPRGPRGHGR